jgi:hypothetical protein
MEEFGISHVNFEIDQLIRNISINSQNIISKLNYKNELNKQIDNILNEIVVLESKKSNDLFHLKNLLNNYKFIEKKEN